MTLKYGDLFVFEDEKTGSSLSDTLSFKYSIEAGKPLIFIQKNLDGTFTYASKAGLHNRKSEALKYCSKVNEKEK